MPSLRGSHVSLSGSIPRELPVKELVNRTGIGQLASPQQSHVPVNISGFIGDHQAVQMRFGKDSWCISQCPSGKNKRNTFYKGGLNWLCML